MSNNYSICKVFKYTDLNKNSFLYLNGPDSADPDKLLKLYINWHNNDYLVFETGEERFTFEFRFEESFCPLDFYEDYQECNINSLRDFCSERTEK